MPVRRSPAGICPGGGLSLLEVLIAVGLLAVIAAISIPAYRGYLATSRDSALVKGMVSMTIFQEDTRLRTGAYGSGRLPCRRR